MTRCDRGLQVVTGGYKWLQGVPGVDKGLQGVTGGYKGLQGVTGGDKGLQGVTKDYRNLFLTRKFQILFLALFCIKIKVEEISNF